MKLDIKGLRPILLTDKTRFNLLANEMKSLSSVTSFARLYMYQKSYGYEFLDVGDRIVVYERTNRIIHYPIGKFTTPIELRKLNLFFTGAGLSNGEIYDVPEEFLDRYPDCDKLFEIEYDEGEIDYIFSVDKIASHDVPKLRKKYNLVKQFQANWPSASVEVINETNIDKAGEIVRNLNDDLPQCQFIDEENNALDRGFRHSKYLNLGGIILYAEKDYPVGVSIFSQLTPDTAIIHFEKAEHAVKGATQTLSNFVAIKLKGQYKFMNREQDYNNEALRHAKRALDPERFFKRYYLRGIR